VVEAHADGGTALDGQALEAGHHPVGVDGALDIDSEGLAAVLVDDVQELSRAHTTLGRIEHIAPTPTPTPLLLAIGHTQALCTPKKVDPLVA
jgi:hypothetical protein